MESYAVLGFGTEISRLGLRLGVFYCVCGHLRVKVGIGSRMASFILCDIFRGLDSDEGDGGWGSVVSNRRSSRGGQRGQED